MKNVKREMKRKGFTLVELLIVIVVIGVLSAMMMLSSTEAVSSAKASDIVSDLRNLKTAALAYYADHIDDVEANPTKILTASGTDKAIFKYMNNEAITGYSFVHGTHDGFGKEWYVKYSGAHTSTVNGSVNGKLAGRAGTVGIYGSADSSDKYEAGDTDVYMFIR